MPKTKLNITIPTDKEDVAITAAALGDPDCPPLDEHFWENAKTGEELAKTDPVIAKLIDAQKKGTLTARPMGRPKKDNPKQATTIRLSPEVIDFFKRGGKGWQTRINNALLEYIETR